METNLAGTSVNGRLLEKLLKENSISGSIRNEYKLDSLRAVIVGEGNGFTSMVLLVHLTWVKVNDSQCEQMRAEYGIKPMPKQIQRLKRTRGRSSSWA